MNGYLLDTNVVSMLAPKPAKAAGAFLEWLERADGEGQVFLSVVTIHEIEKGIDLVAKRSAAKAARLRIWLDGLLPRLARRFSTSTSWPRPMPGV